MRVCMYVCVWKEREWGVCVCVCVCVCGWGWRAESRGKERVAESAGPLLLESLLLECPLNNTNNTEPGG